MKSSDWALIVVAVISLGSAFLSGRSAKAAAKFSSEATIDNTRVLAETEAYNRARRMDIETIERQDREIDEIREQNRKLREKVRVLQQENEDIKEDNRQLRQRVTRLEQHQEETQ